MQNQLFIYNTLSRKKELFEPINPPAVGIYVCGPTVYGFPHLGHSRPAITFDVLFRYLLHLGYKVRYVRNITDVGHLENEVEGEGEDRIAKKARLDKLEPMEVVQFYRNKFSEAYRLLNVLPPSIEPQASGHIIEQQQLVREILKSGFAYESNGSVYFDVEKYNSQHEYGKLSGRKVEDLLSNTRDLDGQKEKRSSLDFALWKKASPEHIMRWPSEWSEGFPGWHLECTAMSAKYLAETFDIHGGGMDLLFPHHECEIAQSMAAYGHEPVKYWMHNNMITINDQKMGKSLNNFINLEEMFSGNHKLLEKAYPPMTIRFFILQAHYRSTLNFSNEALQAAEKGLERLFKAVQTIEKLKPSDKSSVVVNDIAGKCYDAINDDLNTPIAISHLFDGVRIINSVSEGKETLTGKDIDILKSVYQQFVFEILGLRDDINSSYETNNELTGQLIDMLLKMRVEAKQNKDFVTSDKIRNQLTSLGVVIKDTKDGFEWEIK